MDALTLVEFQNVKMKYFTFSNQDNKQWSIPMKNIGVALELYEPSSTKGKLLKKLLPFITGIGVAKKVLNGSYSGIQLNKKLKKLIVKCFGEEWEFSVFWGTPCVDQKVTVQIYKGREILGYCKIGSSERTKALFLHEKKVLELLEKSGLVHVAKCLAVEQVSEQCWAFVQSTKKRPNAETEHIFGKKHEKFLEELFQETKSSLLFEDTDYYQSLVFLEQHLDLIDKAYRVAITSALNEIKTYYKDKTVVWGVSHRDFTPWNTCMVGDNLFVFDFEYALRSAPKGIDRWHFFVQTKYYEEKCDMQQIANSYDELPKNEKEDHLFKCYLLDIISLYLLRGGVDDNKMAEQRAKLMYLI